MVLAPLHPRTKEVLSKNRIEVAFKVIEPVGYFDMIALLKNCRVVLTDSGGLQKEAYFFKKPCVTLRDETEWKELVEGGGWRLIESLWWVLLWGHHFALSNGCKPTTSRI